MAEISGIEAERFDFKVVRSARLSTTDNRMINGVLQAAVEQDFPVRTPGEYQYFISDAERKRGNPNLGMSGENDSLLQRVMHRHSSYRNPRSVVAKLDGKTVGYLAFADNSSSRWDGPAGIPERQAKLHLDKLIARRYRWLGMRAVSPDIDQVETDQVQLIDVMGYLAVRKADIRQPVSTYPWIGETSWFKAIDRWGLRDSGETETSTPFGLGSRPVAQLAYRNRNVTVETVRHNILAIPGANEAVHTVIDPKVA